MPSSNMPKFFLKAFLFIIGVSLVFNGLGTLANRVAPLEDWRADHEQRYDALQKNNGQIEAITLGNSHSDSIDYGVLGVEGQSLALAGADLFEVEKYIEFLDGKLPKLKTVFITISYYSFSRDNAVFESLRTRRVGFYSIVPVWSPIQGDNMNFLLGRVDASTHIMSVARSDSWQGVWTELPNYASPMEAFPYEGIQTTSEWGVCSHYSAEQLDAHAQDIAGRNVTSSRQMANAHLDLEQDAFKALARAIEILQARGVQVILFTPPYYEKYNLYFEEQGIGILDRMYESIQRLEQIYQVSYYDFSHDPTLISVPELFYNSDHLGDCGIQVFSEKLLSALAIVE